eukprot:scaffold301522_cov27-Prasinocladus_malaysianus.AAC.1
MHAMHMSKLHMTSSLREWEDLPYVPTVLAARYVPDRLVKLKATLAFLSYAPQFESGVLGVIPSAQHDFMRCAIKPIMDLGSSYGR